MSSTSETGHGKNVANLEDLISFCTGYGTAYNPSKNSIKLPALNTLFTNSKNSLLSVSTASTAFNNAVNARVIVFEPLKKLTTRILNALEATDASKQTVDDFKTIARKIQGKRASDKIVTVVDDPSTPENEAQKSISASQQSYDNLIDHLSKVKDLLTAEPLYIPNETDLKLTAINTLIADMKTKNTAVITATTALSNSRIVRNDTLYKAITGLVDIAQEVKKYVKSVFGAKSSQYKQVSGLQFRKVKS
jgi:hypothetical protein